MEPANEMIEINLGVKEETEATKSQKSTKGGKKKKWKKLIRMSRLKDISWLQLWEDLKIWMKHPLNVGLVFWCVLATIAFFIAQLVSWHLLDSLITNAHTREQWEETCHQILNALFVLMCLVWHPSFCRSTFKLYRWSDKDIVDLRAEYSVGGGPKPKERTHMLIVLILAHITCIFTYAYAAVFWIYPIGERPTYLFLSTLIISFVAPILGFAYHILSPLSQPSIPTTAASESDVSSLKIHVDSSTIEQDFVHVDSQRPVTNPQWGGSLFGCLAEPPLCCLTLCCVFYVYGSTLQRLGFGNKYAQALTFFLVCFGPYFIFALSTTSISNSNMKSVLLWLGFGLGVFGGMVFGSCWRTVMRETFKLPSSKWCCWSARATDLMTWMFCGVCAICQEARTSKQYDGTMNGSFYVTMEEDRDEPNVLPLEPWQHHVKPPSEMVMV